MRKLHRRAPARDRPRPGPGWAAALVGVVVLLVLTAYYPFDWDPPRTVRNHVTRTAGGTLRFGAPAMAVTAGTPRWLDEARATGRLEADLEVSSWVDPGAGPVAIMMLADGYWDADFVIGQDRDMLLVWLRRTGTGGNGAPPLVVRGVFRPDRWVAVRLRLAPAEVRVEVDGTTRLVAPLPGGSLRRWVDARFALGREVHRGGPWRGEVRRALVRTPGQRVDYLRPGALEVPERFLYVGEHLLPFPPPTKTEWATVVLHLGSFVLVGFLLVLSRRPPARPLPATLAATGIALAIAAGKFLFHGRHAAAADLVVEAAGALLGVLLARRLLAARRHRDADGRRLARV
jgi:VanZ family protein